MRRSSLYLFTFVLAVLVAGCDNGIVVEIGGSGDRTAGSGTIVSEKRTVPQFDRITLAGEGEVVVVDGDGHVLTIETDDNLLPLIETNVQGGTLEIATRAGVDIDPTGSIVYRVTAPEVTGVTLTGAGSFRLDECQADTFSIALSGAGDITIADLTADNLDVALSGAGSIDVAGAVTAQDVDVSGVGDYNARLLESAEASVVASGVGSATVWVTEALDAEVTGVGGIDYYGSPQVTESVSGIGRVNHRSDG